jgi:hypothetical protein
MKGTRPFKIILEIPLKKQLLPRVTMSSYITVAPY